MQQANDKASYSPAFFPQHVSCCFIFPLCPFKSKLILISSLLNPITSSSLYPSWFVFLSQDYSAGSLPNLGYSCYLLLFIFSPVLSLVLLPLPAAAAATAKSLQSCLTLCNPMDCSLPGFSNHGIFLATVLEWGAIVFSFPLPTTQISVFPGYCPCSLLFKTFCRWSHPHLHLQAQLRSLPNPLTPFPAAYCHLPILWLLSLIYSKQNFLYILHPCYSKIRQNTFLVSWLIIDPFHPDLIVRNLLISLSFFSQWQKSSVWPNIIYSTTGALILLFF